MNKAITSVLLLSLIAFGLVAGFVHNTFQNKDVPLHVSDKVYIEFSGFKNDTVIEPIWNNGKTLKKEKIVVSSDNQKIEDINYSNQISYRIKTPNHIIDLDLSNNNENVTVSVSGLKIGNKIALHSQELENIDFIPVDWAGRLTLSNHIQSQNFCISISSQEIQRICHIQNVEVMS
jgi:hypothetical protein